MSSPFLKSKTFFLFLIISSLQIIISTGIFDYSHLSQSSLFIQAGPLVSRKYIIPFGYNSVGICGSQKVKKAEDTLGEILTGQNFYTTGHVAHTNENQYCKILCENDFGDIYTKIMQRVLKRKYVVNYYLDKLPAGLMSYDQNTKKVTITYNKGIPLGEYIDGQYLIYNHLQFHILLNKISNDKFNVVGFNVLPMSIKHNRKNANCEKEEKNILLNLNKEKQYLNYSEPILYTYDIIFEESQITLASRWDHYKLTKKSIHWTGIIVSNILIVIVGIIIALFLSKNLNKDIENYNYRVSILEDINDNDWKQVSGDVFRAPMRNKTLLSSFMGSGIQIFLMLVITLFLGIIGFLNPEKRANLLNIGIIFYCCCGLPGGYVSSSLYKFFGGTNWLKNALLTSVLFPGTLIFGYIIVNIILTIEQSNAAVKTINIISLFVLWVFCTFPLILIGSFLGAKTKKWNIKNKVNPIPSVIPEKPWYLHYRYLVFFTGLIGFATIFIELNYVMASLWRQQIYFMATFLWISVFLFVIITGEMSILVVYWNLCYGDYNWWWKSFIIGGSPVIYFVCYSIYYFFNLSIRRFSAMVVYFGMMGLISAMAMFICGTTSVFLTLGFLNSIYSKIKVD